MSAAGATWIVLIPVPGVVRERLVLADRENLQRGSSPPRLWGLSPGPLRFALALGSGCGKVALVLADRTLFVSGPPHFVHEASTFWELDDAQVIANLAKQSELDKGKNGAVLWAVSAANGKKLAEYRLASLPVWDGMVAANGKLYMTTLKGEVLSFAGKGN